MAGAVRGKRRNIAVGQHCRARLEHVLPSECMRLQAIKTAASYGEDRILQGKNLLHFREFRTSVGGHTRWPLVQRDRNHSLIFGTDVKLVRGTEQGSRQHSGRQDAGKLSLAENSDAEWRPHICCLAERGKRSYLAVGKPLLFLERLSLATSEMQNAAIQSPDPEIRLIARQSSDVAVAQGRVKQGNLPAVVNQNATPFGSN